MSVATTPQDVVAAALAANGGRKFVPADVTPELADAANRFLDRYTGSFDFLLDLKVKKARKPLTAGQVKGVLNCVRADLNRAAPGLKPWQRQVAASTDAGVKGSYTLGDVTVRVTPSRKFKGSFTVKVHTGAATWKSAGFDYAGYVSADGVWNVGKSWSDSLADPNFVNSVEVVLAFAFSGKDLTVARAAYAAKSDRCSHCNHLLDDEASFKVGLGSDCRRKPALQPGAGAATSPAAAPAPTAPSHDVDPLLCTVCGACACCTSCDEAAHDAADAQDVLVAQPAAPPAPKQLALDTTRSRGFSKVGTTAAEGYDRGYAQALREGWARQKEGKR